MSTVVSTVVGPAPVPVAASLSEQLAELDRLEGLARESARTVAGRRLALERARAAVPDRGRFLTARLYPGTLTDAR
ncbi:hypothetical protein [Nocardioides flavescens]|uniref:Uncharacterized protein n=1 Tax=Nocardioides flavescens TaxID=2691959 RepID=A0A6L7ETU7_9ACTN|nr:hypothetical protein [Nocardioides flavescens]MXG90130.1 hypothetical protein [Nocardioides flavescens]